MNRPKPYEVYILECADGTLYTGIARDAEKRLAVHNAGKGAKYTRSRRPLILRYRERCPDRGTALSREYEIKSFSRETKLSLIRTYNEIKSSEGESLMKDFKTIIADRYSERRFDKARDLDPSLLESILEAGRLAPTAHNAQPFRFKLLDRAESDRLMPQMTRCAFGAAAHVVLIADDEEAWHREADGFCASELDIGIAGTQMVLQAEALGVQSCMICAFDPAKCAELLQLKEGLRPIMILAFGYAGEDSKPSPRHYERKSLEDLLL